MDGAKIPDNKRSFMERIILSLSLTLLFSQSVNATPIIDRYYKVPSIEDAHTRTGAAHHTELDSKSIKAFVWNIKKTQTRGWKEEFVNFGKDKDLFLLQEAYESPLYNTTTLELPGIRWDMGVSFMYKIYGYAATGTAIGSKAEPSEIIIKHSVDDEPVVGTPKSMTFAKYPLSDSHKELLVISVHGINITNFNSFKRHMNQAEVEIVKHDGPVIFAGDFNTRTKGRTRHLFELTKKLKLETVNFKNADHRMVWFGTKNYLDHGFVRGLKVKDAEVLKDSIGSDHLPMVMDLAVVQ